MICEEEGRSWRIDPISLDPTLITSYLNLKAGAAGATSPAAGSGAASKPKPPWLMKVSSSDTAVSDLVRNVLTGGKFISADTAKLTALVSDKGSAANYKKLFGLYQGLTALSGLANLAGRTHVSDYDKARYQKIASRAAWASCRDSSTASPLQGFRRGQGQC